MKQTLVEEERQTYESAWGISNYADHSPGERFAPYFVEMVAEHKGPTGHFVLDAGCGAGKGALALKSLGFHVELCDVTTAGLKEDTADLTFTPCVLWDLPFEVGQFDWSFCCDVMEHVPTEFTMLVVAELLRVSRYGAFFSITFAPDNFGALVGHSLHQTVKSFVWWRDRLGELGHVVACRDLQVSGLFLVRLK